MTDNIPTSVAAVDLGSNSFHMIVCKVEKGQLRTIDRLKEMVRLASGLDSQRNLDSKTQKRALDCLERLVSESATFLPVPLELLELKRCVLQKTLNNLS